MSKVANPLGDDLDVCSGVLLSSSLICLTPLGNWVKGGKCRPAVCCMYFGEFECSYFVWESELI